MRQYLKHTAFALPNGQQREFKSLTAAEKWAVKKFGSNFAIQSWYK